ncbi:MAG: hypothetical protein KC477_04140 [Oceanospirillaceae bacterium]|nr:hypothetical protein [Oceanospirillaceae bacterium]
MPCEAPDIEDLIRDIQCWASTIYQQQAQGVLLYSACGMSAQPTVQHEIWSVAEELAAKYDSLLPGHVSTRLADISTSDAELGDRQAWDHFDYIQHALICSYTAVSRSMKKNS